MNISKSQKKDIQDALTKNCDIYYLNTRVCEEGEILICRPWENYDDVLAGVLLHHQLIELPEDWEIRLLEREEAVGYLGC